MPTLLDYLGRPINPQCMEIDYENHHPRTYTKPRHHNISNSYSGGSSKTSMSLLECNGRPYNNGAAASSSSASSTSGGYENGSEESNGCINNPFPSLACLAQNLPMITDPGMQQSNDEKLLDLMTRTGYNIAQRNGQRIFGGPPPNWTAPPPHKGTEIFVGKVPRDIYEWELVPIFEKYGPLYELRLMMDFSGSNRGYFFVRYTDREHAKMAVRELNNYEIRPGKYIGVIPSVDNRKLWISGIPKNRTSTEIQVEMERMTDGVRSVYIYSSHTDKSKTRGYAFVEYETHRAAALARRKLVPGRIFLFDQEIERVDWAEPENEVDDEIMATVKVLFIRNLTMNTSEEMIREIFDGFSQGQVERIKKAKDYAFIHFTSRDAAERAFETTKRDLYIDESLIEVTWSKPIDRQIHNTRKQLTKALTSGSSESQTLPMQPLGGYPHPMLIPMSMSNGFGRGMIQPRPRGAAGIRGLGAPGTAPPRGLMRKLVSNGLNQSHPLYQPNMSEIYELMAKTNLYKEYQLQQQAYLLPPGPQSSPPPGHGGNHGTFMAPPGPNMRMLPPQMGPYQSPMFYY